MELVMEPMWVWLYNARTVEEVARGLLEQAGGAVQADEQCRARAWTWAKAQAEERRRYRVVVDRCVRGALTDADWRWLWRSTGGYRALAVLGARTSHIRFNVGVWLMRGAAASEPVREAALQLVEYLFAVRQGLGCPPRVCGACERVFVPTKITQRWCSPSCMNRMLQRRWRARHRGGANTRELSVGASSRATSQTGSNQRKEGDDGVGGAPRVQCADG
jgi:hypothetical protein